MCVQEVAEATRREGDEAYNYEEIRAKQRLDDARRLFAEIGIEPGAIAPDLTLPCAGRSSLTPRVGQYPPDAKRSGLASARAARSSAASFERLRRVSSRTARTHPPSSAV